MSEVLLLDFYRLLGGTLSDVTPWVEVLASEPRGQTRKTVNLFSTRALSLCAVNHVKTTYLSYSHKVVGWRYRSVPCWRWWRWRSFGLWHSSLQFKILLGNRLNMSLICRAYSGNSLPVALETDFCLKGGCSCPHLSAASGCVRCNRERDLICWFSTSASVRLQQGRTDTFHRVIRDFIICSCIENLGFRYSVGAPSFEKEPEPPKATPSAHAWFTAT